MKENVLVDFYYVKPTKTAWMRFFKKWLVREYPTWIADNLETYHARTGKDWFSSKHLSAMLRDQAHVREIIDDFFDNNTVSVENLRWLQETQKFLTGRIGVRPTFDQREGNFINLQEHRIVTNYEAIHNIALQSIYLEIHEGLLMMIRGERASLTQCPVCKKIFYPSNPSGRVTKFCSGACRQKDYRERKEQS